MNKKIFWMGAFFIYAISNVSIFAADTNRVLSLDGSFSYVAVTNSPNLQPQDEFTVEAWILPNGNDGFFVNKGDSGSVDSDRSYELMWVAGASNNLSFNIFLGTNTWGSLAATVRQGQWTHVAATYSSTDSVMRLFTNGILARETAFDASGTELLNHQKLRQSSQPLIFGAEITHPLGFVDGQLDEVRIWNKARSAQEIAGSMSCALLGTEAGLMGYWNFDSGSADDLTGRGHDGAFAGNAAVVTIAGPNEIHAGCSTFCLAPNALNCIPPTSGIVAWWTGDNITNDEMGMNPLTLLHGATYGIGLVNNAFHFDGVDDGAFAPSSTSLNISNAITLEAWVKHNALGANIQRYLTLAPEKAQIRFDGIAGNKGFHFSIKVAGTFFQLRPGVFPVIGQWHHVVGSYDGQIQKLYVDGSLIASNLVVGTLDPQLTTTAVMSASAEPMNGCIDETLIYNRALSAQEIRSNYLAGAAGMCRPVKLSTSKTPEGFWLVNLQGRPGSYQIESTTNLVQWSPLGRVTNLCAGESFMDFFTNLPSRFYRATFP